MSIKDALKEIQLKIGNTGIEKLYQEAKRRNVPGITKEAVKLFLATDESKQLFKPLPLNRLGEYFMSIRSICTLNPWLSAALLPLLSGKGLNSCFDSSVAKKSFTASFVIPGTFRRFASLYNFSIPVLPIFN